MCKSKFCDDVKRPFKLACVGKHEWNHGCEKRKVCVQKREQGATTSRHFAQVEAGAVFEANVQLLESGALSAPSKKRLAERDPKWAPLLGVDAAATKAAKKGKSNKKAKSAVGATTVNDLYQMTGEILGQGAYASVRTCRNVWTDQEFAVKIIDKVPGHSRARVFKEIDTFYHCRGHKNIIQLVEYFEEADRFYLVFEKINGGQLLDHIQNRVRFTEKEASYVIKDLASALQVKKKKISKFFFFFI